MKELQMLCEVVVCAPWSVTKAGDQSAQLRSLTSLIDRMDRVRGADASSPSTPAFPLTTQAKRMTPRTTSMQGEETP
jgi:hypothetical protein